MTSEMMKSKPIANFGYKVVDRYHAEVETVLNSAKRHFLPLEVGLYYQDAATHELLHAELPDCALLLNTHLDHHCLNIFNLHEQQQLLYSQIETSLEWGASYAITHVSSFLMTPRPAHRKQLMKRLYANMRLLNRICSEYHFPVHIENSYHGIDFYRRLFGIIRHSGFDYIHGCFDLGHAKVWSTEPLREWLDFLDELYAGGTDLHFHLHANHGLSDDHLSFLEAERSGLTVSDHYTAPWDYYEAISIIDERYQHARKVFEVPPAEAVENLRMVAGRIARLRELEQQLSA